MQTEPKNKPQRAVGYVRVSTDEQTQSGLSLEAQRDRLEAYANLHGLDLAELITDAGISAGIPLANRPGGARLTMLVKRGQVDAVLAIKLDRLFRDTANCLGTVREWDKRGVGLHVLDLGGQAADTKSAAGRFVFTVLAGVGEMERGLIKERTSAALERKRIRGEKTGGGVPFGFHVKNGRLIKNAIEARTASKIARWRSGGLTLREIAARLNKQGLRTKQGADWKAIQVSRAIRNAERFGTV